MNIAWVFMKYFIVMRTIIQRWSLCVCLIFFVTNIYAQRVFQESFENGIPSMWTHNPPADGVGWSTTTNGINNLKAKDGNSYAQLYASTAQDPVIMSTLMINFGALTDPVWSFWGGTPKRTIFMDTIKVDCRTATTGAGQERFVCSCVNTDWTEVVISLQGLTATYLHTGLEYG